MSARADVARRAMSTIRLLLPSRSPTVQLICATATLTCELIDSTGALAKDYCTQVIDDPARVGRRRLERARRR